MKTKLPTAREVYGHLEYHAPGDATTAPLVLAKRIMGRADKPRVIFFGKSCSPANFLKSHRQAYREDMRQGDFTLMELVPGCWTTDSHYYLAGKFTRYSYRQTSEMPLVSLTGLDGAKTVGRWAAKFLPKLGDLVRISMNGLGTGMVIGYFTNYADIARSIFYAGVIVRPDVGSRPDWHILQNAARGGNLRVDYHVFGEEIKEL